MLEVEEGKNEIRERKAGGKDIQLRKETSVRPQ